MPRYLVERHFPGGLRIPVTEQGAQVCMAVVENNAQSGVNWVHSYVTQDLAKSFCVYDGPDPDAIRIVAGKNNLPVGSITPVRVLDPFFYRS